MNFTEFLHRLKTCWNVLTDNHPFIGEPKNNCPCYDKDGNQIGWWSRSNAVTLIPFLRNKEDGEWYVLASQRGEGTPDVEFRGCWNVVCGYLDCNESLAPKNDFCEQLNGIHQNTCQRECLEELGVDISDEDVIFWSYNDNPRLDKRQNVTFRFITVLKKDKAFYEAQFSHDKNEKNEVGEIKFIKFSDISKYKWAFNHESLIHRAFNFWSNYEAADSKDETNSN